MTYQIQLPDSLNIKEYEIKMIVASKLFEEGKLSSGQAAEMVGVSKRTFIETIGNYGVSIFGYGEKEFEGDLKNA